MNKPEFWYPAKTWVVTQGWGVSRPEVYGQFGFTQHNGIDFRLGRDKLLYAPFPWKYYGQGNHPNGSGVYLTIISTNEYIFPDGIKGHVLVDFMHLEKVLAKPLQSGKTGSILAVADNTGFSTGPHTHAQFRRILPQLDGYHELDKNEANNSFDPTPYWTGYYAKDKKKVVNILQQQILVYGKIVKLLRSLLSTKQ